MSDTTTEALADIAESNNKLLLSMDELAGWFKMMNQYREGRDLELWLQLYNAGPICVNRKTDNYRIWVPKTFISVTGTTQPEVAANEIFTEKLLVNGFSARILSARPPASIVRWSDKEVDPNTSRTMFELVSSIYKLQGAEIEGCKSPIPLSCTEEAKRIFIDWMNDAAAHAEKMEPALCSTWVKLRAVAARLALILSVTRQMMEAPDSKALEPVDSHCMASGIEIARWFGHELERNAQDLMQNELRAHLEWIVNKHPSGVDVRKLHAGRRRIATADAARDVMHKLAGQGFGRISGNIFVPYG
jgi:hypothetical protein